MELYELRPRGKGEATKPLEGTAEEGLQTEATQRRKGKARARFDGVEEEDEEEEDAPQPVVKRQKGASLSLPSPPNTLSPPSLHNPLSFAKSPLPLFPTRCPPVPVYMVF
jgi:hypothetical protein